MNMVSKAPGMLEQLKKLPEQNRKFLFLEVPPTVKDLQVEFVDAKKIPGYATIVSETAEFSSVVEAHYMPFAKSANCDDVIPILRVTVTL